MRCCFFIGFFLESDAGGDERGSAGIRTLAMVEKVTIVKAESNEWVVFYPLAGGRGRKGRGGLGRQREAA